MKEENKAFLKGLMASSPIFLMFTVLLSALIKDVELVLIFVMIGVYFWVLFASVFAEEFKTKRRDVNEKKHFS